MSNRSKKKLTKRSYGIACIRWNTSKNAIEFLMVKKRNTYAFVEFVMGKYSTSQPSQLRSALNQMTSTEKFMILSRDFSKLWYNVWGYDPITQNSSERGTKFYKRAQEIFSEQIPENTWDALVRYIASSRNGKEIWEMPKGRANSGEKEIDCAIREFYEETNVGRNSYRLLYELGTHSHTITTDNRRYISKYYIAITTPYKAPNHTNMRLPNCEISESRWMDVTNINETCQKNISDMVHNIIRDVKKYHLPELTELCLI